MIVSNILSRAKGEGSRFPKALFGIYVILFLFLSFDPYNRDIWFAENLTVWIIVGILTILFLRGIRFSNTAYLLMSILIFLHTIGGHYTFARVPFEWFNDFFGFERNMYDRIAHFSVGFYAFAIAELLVRFRAVNSKIVFVLFPILSIASIAMAYELIEWVFAITNDPAAGLDYLGSQGDIWDAQKDMLADTLGAVAAMILYSLLYRKNNNER